MIELIIIIGWTIFLYLTSFACGMHWFKCFFFSVAGLGTTLFLGYAFIHWLAHTHAIDERMVPTLVGLLFLCLSVGLVII